MREAAMITPVQQVGRLGDPHIVAAQCRAAGAVQGVIQAADLFVEDRTILVMRRKDHALRTNLAPVARAPQPHPHAMLRDLGIGEVIGIADPDHPAILNAERFQFPRPDID